MTRLLDIGVSGLNAHQRALTTTGHNIANAGVEGYSRQEVVFETLDPQYRNDAFVGSGVKIATIKRITDEFLVRQSMTDQSRVSELDVLRGGIEQLDQLLANENTGLSGSLNELFASLQATSESPTSLALRQQVLDNAERLVDRYQGISAQIQSIAGQSDEAMVALTREINSIAVGIADLNSRIQSSPGIPDNDQINDLLDRRDQLLRELSEKVAFTTSQQGDGMINVFIGGGQALVLAGNANELSTVGGDNNNPGLELAISIAGVSKVITERINGGSLGGILKLRSEGLGDAENQLGLVQTLVSHSFNSLHSEGVDLNGLQGGDFFTGINDRNSQLYRSAAAISNKADTVVSVVVDDPSALVASDYSLDLSASGGLLAFSLKRLNDGVVVGSGAIPPNFPQSLTVSDGFTVTLESGSFQAGDKFILSPTRLRPQSVDVLVNDPASLALALPVNTSEGVGNLGSGSITQVEASDTAQLSLVDAQLATQLRDATPPLVLRFTSESTYDVLDNSDPAQPVQLVPPLRGLQFLPGRNNQILDFDLKSSLLSSTAAFAFTATAGPIGTTNNGNGGEIVTLTTTDSATGVTSTQTVTILSGESAAVAATRLSSVNSVSATANTELQMQLNDDGVAPPLELRLNGVELTAAALGPVPDPVDTAFLAQRINQLFTGSGIVAQSNGPDLSIRSVRGEDLTLENFGTGADTIGITSINGAAAALSVAAGQEAVVAGTLDVVLGEGAELVSTGGFLAGATPSALPAYLGYQVVIAGQPVAGDEFEIVAGNAEPGDNRNARALAALQTADIAKGGRSINNTYAQLVGSVGNKAAAARIDSEAAQSILTQTRERISAVSGVNLDEEAAKLLQYEQVYNASARVISIARSTFDSLLAAFN